MADFAERGISLEEPPQQIGEGGPKICFVRNPDGYRIEFVQFPPGHADGVTRADFS